MAATDSEDETLEELEYDGDDDPEAEGEEEPLETVPEDATEDGDESASDDSEVISDDDEYEDNDSETFAETLMEVDQPKTEPPPSRDSPSATPVPPLLEAPRLTQKRSLSPAQLRKGALVAPIGGQSPIGSYSVEAICALPHPAPTHALASSFCMTHLLTGSDDGYIRNYDIFSAVNSKIFLTAPQRHHSGVVEGIMKAGQLRCWWENPAFAGTSKPPGVLGIAEEPPSLSPVYSLVIHSDGLWTLAGTDAGHINLFTTRHEPGRLIHTLPGHRGPVSALSMSHDEKSLFSAGWDGEATQWDLNNGQRVRTFTSHGAQLAAIAVRPLTSNFSGYPSERSGSQINSLVPSNSASSEVGSLGQVPPDSDAKSDASFDPLFDDEPDAPADQQSNLINNPGDPTLQYAPPRSTLGQIPPSKNAPPLLDSANYLTYSPDLLMTASIDGQVILWDRRVRTTGSGVGRLWMSEKTPPWCLSACWSADGGQVYAGRRNGSIDVWDVRQTGRSGPSNTPRLLKTLRNPLSSGVVSCVVAFPDCRHIACASIDNLRLWNVAEASEPDSHSRGRSGAQFKIIPGHHGGYISQMLIDPGARFLVSASSNRGWHGESTRTVFVHDIKRIYTS